LHVGLLVPKPMTFNDLEWLFEVAYILFQGRSLVVGAAT